MVTKQRAENEVTLGSWKDDQAMMVEVRAKKVNLADGRRKYCLKVMAERTVPRSHVMPTEWLEMLIEIRVWLCT